MKKEKDNQELHSPMNSSAGVSKRIWLTLVLCAVAVFSYHNTFRVPFILDGRAFIDDGGSAYHLWPLSKILSGTSRPLVKLSFVVNHYLGKPELLYYHLVNLGIHILAALALLGLIRRTLLAPKLKLLQRYPVDAIAFTAAILWVAHPLQTESVTYIYQRSESLMGFFYLFTLYSLARALGASKGSLRWFIVSVISCLAGMSSKLVMVTAPFMALAYDRIFWASSWKQIWCNRRWLYYCLAGSWIVFFVIAFSRQESRYTAGFGIKITDPLHYALTQPAAIMHYLKLALWPYGLALDNGWPFALRISSGVWPVLAVLAALLATIWSLRRHPAFGFLGLWFFLILIPTSSFFPLADPIFEHRMYLPLAAVILAAVFTVRYIAERLIRNETWRYCLLSGMLLLAVGFLSIRSVHRNQVYLSRRALWNDVVLKRPDNPRGHSILARILAKRGAPAEAVIQYKEALRCRKFGVLKGDDDPAVKYYNMALDFDKRGQLNKAISTYRQAIALKPRFLEALNNLAVALARKDNFRGAFKQMSAALALAGDNQNMRNNMRDLRKCILVKLGKSQREEDLFLMLNVYNYK